MPRIESDLGYIMAARGFNGISLSLERGGPSSVSRAALRGYIAAVRYAIRWMMIIEGKEGEEETDRQAIAVTKRKRTTERGAGGKRDGKKRKEEWCAYGKMKRERKEERERGNKEKRSKRVVDSCFVVVRWLRSSTR